MEFYEDNPTQEKIYIKNYIYKNIFTKSWLIYRKATFITMVTSDF